MSDSRVKIELFKPVAGAVQADHQPIADQLVAAYPLDVGDILYPHGLGTCLPAGKGDGHRHQDQEAERAHPALQVSSRFRRYSFAGKDEECLNDRESNQ